MVKLIVIGTLIALWGYCSRDNQTAVNDIAQVRQDTLTTPRIDFAKDIQPILQKHCAPCHFATGIMWIRMPFDDPQTLRDKSEAILKRIDDPEEVKKIREFLEQKEL